ncbi:MAG: TIGR01212 family radical SAM protein [Clostridia bacterium]|nr:TIGR01212 family radical SAM protein [Clostridia bacterium]
MTQKESNPFAFSDTNKRYHTYDYYTRHAFGAKCAKIPLDGGFTCPNRDGSCGTGGCIFCSAEGSGEFTASGLSIAEQYRLQRERLKGKWSDFKCIPYFQAYTNTYAPLPRLKTLFEEAVAQPDAVGISIATRADCLPDDVLHYLAELSGRTVVTLELGLQTAHDETALRINRGHTFATFVNAYRRVRELAPRVRIGIHLILGLIGENDEMMVQTVQKVAELEPDEVKIHCLYVTEHTKLAEMYRNGGYFPLEREAYANLVVKAIELLPPTTVIGRLTGDGDVKSLLAPLWSRDKRKILNEIDKKFYANNSFQGKRFLKSADIKP